MKNNTPTQKKKFIPPNKLTVPSKKILEQMYIDKKMSMRAISRHFNCSAPTVKKWFKSHGISLRSHSDTISIAMEPFRRVYDTSTTHTHPTEKNEIPDSLVQYIKSYDNSLEIDNTTIKTKSLWIDYCVVSHHTCNGGNKSKKYHQDKMKDCAERGIRLITIFSNEWYNKEHIVKSRLASALGMSKRIYARKCAIRTLTSKESLFFFTQNHIQGDSRKQYAYGLLFENELVAAMSFSDARYTKKYQYELIRFANKIDHSVVGGASKLFAHFIKMHSPVSVISYCDLRWGTGNVYKNMGLRLKTPYTSPNYFYTSSNCQTLESRLKYQKHKLINVLETYNESLTEQQNMLNNGYDWIYDCGNSAWVLRTTHDISNPI